MRLQDEIDRSPRRFERGIVERALRKRRRKTRRDQQYVAFTQGNLQSFGELEHHFARRRSPAGFDETEVTRGYLGVSRQIELAQVAALPPFAQVIADMDGLAFVRLAPWKHVRSCWKTYHANFTHSITSEVIETGHGLDHLGGTGDDPC